MLDCFTFSIGRAHMHYVAVFHPAEEHPGGYVVTFPDLPGCVTQGEDFSRAFAMRSWVMKTSVFTWRSRKSSSQAME